MSLLFEVKSAFAVAISHRGERYELIVEDIPLPIGRTVTKATLIHNDKPLCCIPCLAENVDSIFEGDGAFKTLILAYQMMACRATDVWTDRHRDSVIHSFGKTLEFMIPNWYMGSSVYYDDEEELPRRNFYKIPFCDGRWSNVVADKIGRSFVIRQEMSIPDNQLICIKVSLEEINTTTIQPGAVETDSVMRIWVHEDAVPLLHNLLDYYILPRINLGL